MLRRYGPGTGAFLLPVYGGGELPQAFCRVAAVAGALYVLRQGIGDFLVDPATGLCHALMTDSGQARDLPALLPTLIFLGMRQQPASIKDTLGVYSLLNHNMSVVSTSTPDLVL